MNAEPRQQSAKEMYPTADNDRSREHSAYDHEKRDGAHRNFGNAIGGSSGGARVDEGASDGSASAEARSLRTAEGVYEPRESVTSQPLKGKRLAQSAAMLCQDKLFWLYLDRRYRYKFGLSESDLPDGTHCEQDARDWLCRACQVSSRAELDHNAQAASTFRIIRNRFARWRSRLNTKQ